MRYLSLVAVLFLSACQSAPLLPSGPAPANAVTAQSNARIFETFSGYLLMSPYDALKKSEMGMNVKSLLGKTYDNRNSASRYHLYINGQSDGFSSGIGPIRLTQDGGLYFEKLTVGQGRVYYRLGSYTLPPGAQSGQAVTYRLDQGVSFKMDWRGLNPMDHDEIHVRIPANVSPSSLDPATLR